MMIKTLRAWMAYGIQQNSVRTAILATVLNL